jgi:DNA gyrase/topoisomerase IV subunit B
MAQSIEDKYKKYELREHIYNIPDTYIGSVNNVSLELYLLNDDTKKMEIREINYVPGLLKIFDEVIVNAIDHSVRLTIEEAAGKENIKHVKNIKVSVDKDTGIISVYNDGNGIDVVIHEKLQVYVPELITGTLLTSTNYNHQEEKIIGGKGGYGLKLTNIFSKEFTVETVDYNRQRIFVQNYRNNMLEKDKPSIRSTPKQPYTKITFLPDYARFGMTRMTDDIFQLLKRRTIDAAACTNKNVSVFFNDEKLPVKDFEKYAGLFIQNDEPLIYEACNERWEIAVSGSNNGVYEQISFVNGINTIRGGTHVNYITNAVVKKLSDMIEAKKKKIIKAQTLKDNLFIFVKSTIVNPAFDSQSKETLTTPVAKFGSKCDISDKFIEKLYKTNIVEKALSLTEFQNQKKLTKTDGKKTSRLIIPKLDDANLAGTKDSTSCTLILTEGDSAKTMAISGLSIIGRDKYGVFPLRGKVMNVKDAAAQKISDNAEITALKKILGLEQNKKYSSTDSLRYGSIMILTDQDHDGSHIKGLLFNVFQSLWNSLYKMDGFLTSMLTPIIKATSNKGEIISFYNMSDYERWSVSPDAKRGSWKIKYYKGLGTSKDEESKEYFKNMKKITYTHTDHSDEYIDLAFNKKRADDRKAWLMNYQKDDVLDYTKPTVNYEEFINRDLIHFSNRDLERSIPNICDGLKESTRKILYACLKRKLFTNEIKVAQLAGHVSEVTAYHHGEQSLQQAIVGMAQIFVGTNNINMLAPNGQFGCLDPNTDILMSDLSTKKAKDIQVGDKLVGDDGKFRTVLKTTSGIDNMYKIQMRNGESYIVNSQHILTLKYTLQKTIIYKDSGKIWVAEYYDSIRNKVITKSVSIGDNKKEEKYNTSKLTKEEAYNKLKQELDSIKIPDTFDIKLEDFLKLPQSRQEKFACVKNSKCIDYNFQEVPIEPYILGCWLGDGNSDGSGITSIDNEVLESFVLYLDTIGCEMVHHKAKDNHDNYHFTFRKKNNGFLTSIGDENHSSETCIGCSNSTKKYKICDFKFTKSKDIDVKLSSGVASNGMRRTDMNPWKELLKQNILFNNKHIPQQYILNSKEVRLQLLAGFIDTDGCIKYNKNSKLPRVEISQSKRLRHHIIESLQTIANSLGYRTTISYGIHADKTNKGEDKTISILTIWGDNIYEIPTRVSRKKMDKAPRMKDAYNIRFTIEDLGKSAFNGWSVDGNERFLLGDYTITHNSRIHGGSDASSPRYIFTLLSELTKLIFKEEDNSVLNYLEEDGQNIEPEYYIPIIPMILANGGLGIGTGFSTNVPQFDPSDIISACIQICNAITTNMISNDDIASMHDVINSAIISEFAPWYMGFTGSIEKTDKGTFISKGIYKWIDDNTLEITELPIGTWTEDYKEFLEGLITNNANFLKSFENHYTSKNVKFILYFNGDIKTKLGDKFDTEFKLVSSKNMSINNMHLYNSNGAIKKYETTSSILKEWALMRITKYDERKKYQIKILEKDHNMLSIKIRFIIDVIEGRIQIMNKKISEISQKLIELKYPKMNDLHNDTDSDNSDDTESGNNGYNYLLKMPISQLTYDRKIILEKEVEDLTQKINNLKNTSIEKIWKEELLELLESWNNHKERIEEDYQNDKNGIVSDNKPKRKARAPAARKGKAA